MPTTEYIVRSHKSGRITSNLRTEASTSVIAVSLALEGYDILCAFSLNSFEGKAHGPVSVTNLGLIGKMTGCAAILNTKIAVQENSRLLVVATVKALGVLGMSKPYCA